MKLLSLLAVALALAGCGGSDDTSSADAYRKQATEICTTATTDAAEVARPSDTAASVAAYGAAVGEIRQRETLALSELEPPDDLEKSHTLLVNASGAIVRSLTDLTAAAKRGDQVAAQAASTAGTRVATQARRAADELGLPACGNPGAAR